MQTIKRVALSSPESSYPDGKSRYVVSQMFTQFGGHSGEVKLYDYDREVSRPASISKESLLTILRDSDLLRRQALGLSLMQRICPD